MPITICPECAKRIRSVPPVCPDCGWSDASRTSTEETPVEAALLGDSPVLGSSLEPIRHYFDSMVPADAPDPVTNWSKALAEVGKRDAELAMMHPRRRTEVDLSNPRSVRESFTWDAIYYETLRELCRAVREWHWVSREEFRPYCCDSLCVDPLVLESALTAVDRPDEHDRLLLWYVYHVESDEDVEKMFFERWLTMLNDDAGEAAGSAWYVDGVDALPTLRKMAQLSKTLKRRSWSDLRF